MKETFLKKLNLHCFKKIYKIIDIVKLNEDVYKKYSVSSIKTVYTYDSVSGMVRKVYYSIKDLFSLNISGLTE